MDAIIVYVKALWKQAYDIWLSGGSCMPAIALNALVMFALGIHVHLKLRKKGFQSMPENTWRHWIDHPAERKGPIGKLLDFVTNDTSFKEASASFQELRATELVPFERDLRVMRVCITTSPLLGLLGTVTGMLATFGALASGSGGEKTMGLIARGISEALITTEAGLVIALPGLIFQHLLARRHERYKAFLDHLESVCNQKFYKKIHNFNEVS